MNDFKRDHTFWRKFQKEYPPQEFAARYLSYPSKGDDGNSGAPKVVHPGIAVIELGLPSGRLWADRNVLAESPEDAGAFFSWGNVEPHFPGNENDWGANAFGYQFSREEYAKTEGSKLEDDIPATHDAATVNLGKPWRMPSKEDFEELSEHCDWVRKTINGVKGYLVTSKANGNTLFFPVAGIGYGTSLCYAGAYGRYWSRSLYSSAYGYTLHFDSPGVSPASTNSRLFGFSVRAVM